MIRPEQAFFLEAQSPYSKARHAGHLCLLVGMHRVTLGSIRVADFPSLPPAASLYPAPLYLLFPIDCKRTRVLCAYDTSVDVSIAFAKYSIVVAV